MDVEIRVAVIVPFQDRDPRQHRAAQLEVFLATMPAHLDTAFGVGAWGIQIAEQADAERMFSRARMLNAGVQLALKRWENVHTLILHDVDLIPDAVRLAAACSPSLCEGELRALNVDSVWYKDLVGYTGGIASVSVKTFLAANGFLNAFEGWGGEDDAFRDAVRRLPGGVLTSAVPGTVRDLDAYRCAMDWSAKMPKEERVALRRTAAHKRLPGLGQLHVHIIHTTVHLVNVVQSLVTCDTVLGRY